jgi:hypothetical protein
LENLGGNKMKMQTAIRKAKEGYFEFIEDVKTGTNVVRFQTPSGKWKEKQIEVTE